MPPPAQELKRRSPRLLITVSPYRDTWRAIYRPLLTGKYGRHVDTVLFQAYAYQDVSPEGPRGGGAARCCVHVIPLACTHRDWPALDGAASCCGLQFTPSHLLPCAPANHGAEFVCVPAVAD